MAPLGKIARLVVGQFAAFGAAVTIARYTAKLDDALCDLHDSRSGQQSKMRKADIAERY